MPREKSPAQPLRLPMMPLRDMVIFPHQMTPFVVGRPSSVKALEAALLEDKKIFLATQHDASLDEPQPNQIHVVGTIASIVQSVRLADGNVRVLVEGLERGRTAEVDESEGFFRVTLRQPAAKAAVVTPQLEQLMQKVTGL
ncbi:MAG TPA: LON peptidase substrate-binding domain-containing protein, partial [Terriglobales bacterium]|nr:LON peptidase substrate-binding domain-containing protein [Terriglobales bacterium]